MRVAVGRLRQWGNVLCISRATVNLLPLVLQIEQNTPARLLRLVSSLGPLLEELSELQERLERAEAHEVLNAEEANLQEASERLAAGLGVSEHSTDGGAAGDGDDEPGIGPSELFLQEVLLGAISINASVLLDAICSPASLQPFHPSCALLHVSEHIAQFEVQGWKLKLPKLAMPEAFETTDSLVARVIWHYLRPLFRASYRLLLAASSYGALVQDMKGGMIALAKAPTEAVNKGRSTTRNTIAVASGLRQGIVGLTAAVPAFALDYSAGVCHSVEKACAAVSLDAKYRKAQSLSAQDRPQKLSQGLAMGGKLVYTGAVRGVAGLVLEPYHSAKRHKRLSMRAVGFGKGVVRGVAGLVATPTAAAFGAAAKTCEGLSSEVRKHTHEGQQREARQQILRVRQPRLMGPNAVLRAYPRPAPLRHPLSEGDAMPPAAAAEEPASALAAGLSSHHQRLMEELQQPLAQQRRWAKLSQSFIPQRH